MSKLIIGNWKMNGSIPLLNAFIDSIHCENFVLAVPNVFVAYSHMKDKFLKLAAQDCSIFQGCGARTGEISADILKESGAEFIILGHSERRALSSFDGIDSIYKKLNNSIKAGLKVILCVAENFNKLLDKNTSEFIINNIENIYIAFEPISAIGSGKAASLQEIVDTLNAIKSKFSGIKCIYGGSVNSENSAEILTLESVDGVLIGGSSLRLGEMKAILGCDAQV
ncbi:triosephosphate isomerase [Alphaproteobacteria bacterium]|nr:triosephosphate isomerase [Alphaproteobacteria bacterium]